VGAWDHLTQKERERKERERNVAEAMNGTQTQQRLEEEKRREEMMESVSQRLAEFKKKTDARMPGDEKPPPLGLVAVPPPPVGLLPRPPALGVIPPPLVPPPGQVPAPLYQPPSVPNIPPPPMASIPPPVNIPKATPLVLGKKSSFGIKMALAPKPNIFEPKAAAKEVETPKAKLKAVFNPDESSDEDDEIPTEARMRMKNVGRQTITSSGPNSFGKGSMGFYDHNAMLERQLKAAMDAVSGDGSEDT